MDSFICEDNTSFACAYCAQELGTLTALIENQILAEHACLKDSDNVNVNYETRKIHADTELKDSHCSNLELSSNQPNDNVPSLNASSLLSSPSQSNNNVASTSMTPTSEIWTDNVVKLLITIYKENKKKFDSPSFTKKKVWEIISTKLNTYGYNKSGVKCDEKWRNLRKTYDKVRTEISKTGNSKVTWKFYEDFHEIYWKDPHFVPIATASTTAVKRKLTETDISNVSKEDGSTEKKNLSLGETSNIKPKFTAAEIEMRKQNRHDEKMKMKKDIFEWFKENIKKE